MKHTMNFYWGSNTRLSFLRYLTLASFRALHSDWEMVLWSSDWSKVTLGWDFHEFQSPLSNKHDWIEEAKSLLGVQTRIYTPKDPKVLDMPPPNISDIFSYETLVTEGGWYGDLDIMFLKNFDSISDNNYAFIGFGDNDDWVGIFGAEKGSWVMQSFYEACLKNYSSDSYNSTGTYGIIRDCTSNMDWCNRFKQPDQGLKNWRAPKDMFYPVRVQHTSCLWSDTWETPRPNTWAVHLYGGNQDYALYNRKITPEYVNNNNSQEWVCRFIRGINRPDLIPKTSPKGP